MRVIHAPSPNETCMLDTDGLRDAFLLEELFQPGEIVLVYTDLDRAIVGSAVPGASTLELNVPLLRFLSGWASGSQPLKSPSTDTGGSTSAAGSANVTLTALPRLWAQVSIAASG